MSYEMQRDTQRLERALRENTSGEPQLLEYNTRDGNMSVIPASSNAPAPSQFGCLCREAMTRDFGGTDVIPGYDYSEETGNVVEVLPPTESTSDSSAQEPGRQFGTLLGRSFTSTFGCDITVASLRGDDLIRPDTQSLRGYAYTLEGEGVVRILRGEADVFAKGTVDAAVFVWGDPASEIIFKDVRYIVSIDENGNASVVEKTSAGERSIPKILVVPATSAQHSLGFGLIESQLLKERRVLLLGCGSMGGDIAMHLAMSGIGGLVLVDPDRVEASNLSRLRDAVIADVGRLKVDVLAERIAGKNPCCHVIKVTKDITKETELMVELLADVDIAVVSTDNRVSRILFANGLQIAKKPCIFTRCSTRAESGDCFISRPREACYECLYGSVGGTPEEVDDFESAKKSGRLAAYCTPEEMHDFAILPGISADISAITAFAARMAIWELARSLDENPFAKFAEEFSAFNYFLYVNRREKYFCTEAWAPFDKSAHRPCPQRWYGAAISRRADCTCCGDRSEELDVGDDDAAAQLKDDGSEA